MNDYSLHTTTNPYLDQVRAHKDEYTVEVLGKKIIVFPDVMSPKYDWSSRFHVENMPNQSDKNFLEIGSGCGIISVFAHLQGAQNITAIDINPAAVANTKKNFELHGVKGEAFESNLFDQIEGTFDSITWAAPYHGSEPADFLEHGVSDHNYQYLKQFMKEVSEYLNEDGQVILGFSDTGDNDLLNKLIEENDFELIERKEESNDGWTAYLYILESKSSSNSK